MKPSIPKGTRDFSPTEMVRRNFIFKTIREVFEKYGYQPIETPAMENMETLTGKYGDEGDKLIFKILDSGDFWNYLKDKYLEEDPNAKSGIEKEIAITKSALDMLNTMGSAEVSKYISEKAL